LKSTSMLPTEAAIALGAAKDVTFTPRQALEMVRRILDSILDTPVAEASDAVLSFQRQSDQAVISAAMLSKERRVSPASLKCFGPIAAGLTEVQRHLMESDSYKGLMAGASKALDTETIGEGAEWVPQRLSEQVQEDIRPALRAALCFKEVRLGPKGLLPVAGARARAYLQPQAIGDNAVNVRKSTPALSSLTIPPVKVAAATAVSAEAEEDITADVAMIVRNMVGMALAEAREEIVLNGSAAPAIDADVVESDDVRFAADGLRAWAIDTGATMDLSTLTSDSLLALVASLDKGYRRLDSNAAILVSERTSLAMANLKDSAGNPVVSTVAASGELATIRNGLLGTLFSVPILVCDKIREDLDASGVNTDPADAYTALYYVGNTGSWLWNRARDLTIASEYDLGSDSSVIVARERIGLKCIRGATCKNVGLGVKMG
jgi:HK97 family phage major capsid protein